MNQSSIMVQTRNLNKNYGDVRALRDVSVSLSDSGIYGLYGRNGAGKTTLLNILAGRLFADSGIIYYQGEANGLLARNHAQDCCYMPEKHYFPGRYSTARLIDVAALCYPNFDRAEAERLARSFELDISRKYEQLSRGYQSIVRIVIGLAANTPLTIFDEPVLGLDAVARDQFYGELIESYGSNPRTMVVSTHLIEESADLFNEAIIIDKGTVLRQSSIEDLQASAYHVSGRRENVEMHIKDKIVYNVQSLQGLKAAVVEGNWQEQPAEAGLTFAPLTVQKLFIHLTGGTKEEEARS